jgi:hypothetical protein
MVRQGWKCQQTPNVSTYYSKLWIDGKKGLLVWPSNDDTPWYIVSKCQLPKKSIRGQCSKQFTAVTYGRRKINYHGSLRINFANIFGAKVEQLLQYLIFDAFNGKSIWQKCTKYGAWDTTHRLKYAAKFQRKCWWYRRAPFVPFIFCWWVFILRILLGEIGSWRMIKMATVHYKRWESFMTLDPRTIPQTLLWP